MQGTEQRWPASLRCGCVLVIKLNTFPLLQAYVKLIYEFLFF